MPTSLHRASLDAGARRLLIGVLATVWGGVFHGCASGPERAGRPPPVSRASKRAAPAGEGATGSVPAAGDSALAASEASVAQRYSGAPSLERFRGEASYYSDALAGRSTASGEPYDPSALTAAHRSLPFASIVRVVREDTAQVVYVRVNDRGPFVRGRVLDLSRAAAERLGLIRRGVAKVKVEVVEYGPKRSKQRARRSKRR